MGGAVGASVGCVGAPVVDTNGVGDAVVDTGDGVIGDTGVVTGDGVVGTRTGVVEGDGFWSRQSRCRHCWWTRRIRFGLWKRKPID